ncbi:MAG: hypothetical protein AAGA60_32145 [Cyanobacteria bacterium P01_E01_bin.42]
MAEVAYPEAIRELYESEIFGLGLGVDCGGEERSRSLSFRYAAATGDGNQGTLTTVAL